MPPSPRVTHVLETALYVDDLDRARDFYRDILGLHLHAELPGRHAFFHCGNSMVLLFNPAQTEKPEPVLSLPTHGSRGPGHIAWRVTPEEMDAWRAALPARGVAIKKEHTWPSGGRSLYFRDPAGNSLELATAAVWA
ncbi:MAG: VOC family protein [Opitutaceae bacterium]|nr:VOC family protein [Opitutaceae bacterium]